jgi:uncharacterized protein (UPF0332 family)
MDIEHIKYRIDRSKELYEDALILAQNNRWRSCVNRLYYSCFHIVDALLYKDGFISKSHDGLKTQFFLKYIKSNIIEKKYGKLYAQLID